MLKHIALLVGIGLWSVALAEEKKIDPKTFFGIQVVDDQTGRGVPLVEFRTTAACTYYTDSNGWIAFYEPGLMNRRVYFEVSSNGYQIKPDGLGIHGVTLETTQGETRKIEIHRLNIAERLYRVTGAGIYRDSVLLGQKTPIEQPLLNAEVTGQDSVMNVLHNNKLYWFYGDTGKISYALGNFAMTGATTELPGKLDPEKGISLHYFTNERGTMKAMSPMAGEGVVWLLGIVNLKGSEGRDKMLAFYHRRRGMGAVLDNGFVIYNDQKEEFEILKRVPLEAPVFPTGSTAHVRVDETNYIYFTNPYPSLRVKADYDAYLDLASYEAYTCYKAGTKELDRAADGKLVWGWKKGGQPINPMEQAELVKKGKMKLEESEHRLADAASGKAILLNNCSCFWNEYRKKYIMIASEVLGDTGLGEVWYSESERPEGPWTKATKIVTHANKKDDAHDLYNPAHHPFLDREGGRVIYFEGTYSNGFSGNKHSTPWYEYNQIMYKLDLADPRLKLD